MPEPRVEWSVTVKDRRETWMIKLYEDGALVIQHNERALQVGSNKVMELVDAFCDLFGLNKRGV